MVHGWGTSLVHRSIGRATWTVTWYPPAGEPPRCPCPLARDVHGSPCTGAMSQVVHLVPASPAGHRAAGRSGRSGTRPVDIQTALVDVAVRAAVVAALILGLVAFCGWAGR